MANDNEINLDLKLDSSDAEKGLKSFEKNAKNSVQGIEKAFGALKIAAGAALAFFAGKAIVNGLESIVEAASESDTAVRKLGTSLAITGEFSEKAVKDFEDFAAALQKTTTLTDEAVLGAVSLAKSFNLTNEQAKQVTKAAVDLSAATGEDLNSSVEKLSKTFSGQAGLLSKQVTGLKGLTAEQLKNGAAIDIVAKQYEGFAAAASKTFGGAVTQTRNAFGEIFESLGKVITQNPVVIALINQLGKAFAAISGFVDENKESISALISKAIKALISVIPKLIDGFTLFVAILDVVVDLTGDFIQALLFLGKTFFNLTKPIRDVLNILGNVFSGAISILIGDIIRLARAIPGVSTSLKGLGIDIDAIQKSVDGFSENRLSDVLSLDTSVSDQYSKFVNETIDDVSALTESARSSTKSFLDTVGTGSAKVADFARTAVAEVDKVKESTAKVTDGIKNGTKALNDFADTSKLLESVKGSFDKIKGAIDGLQQEIDKQVLTATQLVDAEEARAKQLFKNATLELKLEGKITEAQKEQLDNIENLTEAEKENLKIQLGAGNAVLVQFDSLIKKKAQLAKEKITFGQLSLGEITSSITGAFQKAASGLGKAFNSIADSSDIFELGKNAAASFGESALELAGDIGEKIAETTAGDIANGVAAVADGISTAFSIGADIASGILSGQFIKAGFDVVQTFLQFPKAILAVFKDFGKIVDDLITELPTIITEIINQLPTLAVKIAEGLGKIVDLLVQNAPQIFASIIKSIETVIDKLVEKLPEIASVIGDAIVKSTQSFASKLPSIITALAKSLGIILSKVLGEALPALIDALPAVFKAIFDALPDLIKVILAAIPKILDSIFKALPGIVKAIADALPDIILAIVNGLPDIIESLLTGVLTAIPEIIDALITSFLVEGGLERLVVGLIKATPRIALALAKGLLNGLVNGGKSSFAALGKYFTAGFGNIFGKLGGNFGVEAGVGIKNAFNIGSLSFFSKMPAFFTGIQTAFATAALNLVNGIKSAFTQGASQIYSTFINLFSQLYQTITSAFYNVFAGLYSTIVNAFNSVFGSLYATIVNAFNSIFGSLYNTIVSAFTNIFGGISNAIADGGNRLKDAFFEPVNRLIDFLNNFSFPSITGGAGGILGGIGGAVGGVVGGVVGGITGGGGGGFGFATGGLVPEGFPNDSFPARLTSGELIIPKDDVAGLRQLIADNQAGNSGGTDPVVANLLSQILVALSAPMTVQTTAEVDGRGLADIILNLSRNNARLTA